MQQASVTQDPLRGVRGWVRLRVGIHYSDDKLEVLAGRLRSVCYKADLPDFSALHDLLVSGSAPHLEALVVQAVSTNHTAFFRESDTFQRLRSEVLATLPDRGQLRFWSAAASTGQEAYSIAMCLSESFGLEAARRRCAVLGTDIHNEVLSTAERGVYDDVSGISADLLARYTMKTPRGVQVRPELRELCLFRRLNLMRPRWPFRNRFHVIFCRNVLYYFETESQAALLRRMYEHVEPGGWLITSVTESLRGLDLPWARVAPGFYRRPERP